ncbi:hypothetical protein GF343_02615 [Candidatus Woesearchaeota archaeon]|nr:hypothetical protein [Candidatus Woesearchaeota archaeon]
MRSARYFLGSIILGKHATPHNIDDCLDFSRKSTPKNVSVELYAEEFRKELVFRHLSARYTWTFENKQAEYSILYEMIFAADTPETRKVVVDQANQVLEEDLERIEAAKIPVKGNKKRFGYGLVY